MINQYEGWQAGAGKEDRQETVDESSKRTAVIWPWLTSITVSGEFICAGYIVSPRQDLRTTFKQFTVEEGGS